ncbi:gas vesicle protein GvpA/GvpJ/GvpM family [Saccharopolyspora erythraea NRRL 2338]|uniref:Gas vesicle protein A n=2 Tax=Saccharopolyspora erythraea TaxID=1836 RepID=A4F8D1_SACEN|nr:gas vesicle protein GvpJ [Saccharopolyspora erythraea]EQD85337.1 gas vesicle protein [Saccharopolyspora erythraea D]PFG94101.1 gas vesicle protein GvpA/GvpJ/GvpM family [Saccharopolyspora erythraea NRRL 2338]QRK90893.1 gas vesicle structural protein GvpA [Saccharopolyspora erythraea]CAM00306.1 gas vesicle synthesis-like protein [Saccharopolyspora erythraea NRRL 2338]
MTLANTQAGGGQVQRGGAGSSSLADVVEMILEKGIVIDAFVRVSLVGIELITIDARVVVASVDTYLRFAEATNRLDLHAKGGKDLPELMQGMSQGVTQGGAHGKTKGVLDAAKEKIDEFRTEEPERERQPARRRESRGRERGES